MGLKFRKNLKKIKCLVSAYSVYLQYTIVIFDIKVYSIQKLFIKNYNHRCGCVIRLKMFTEQENYFDVLQLNDKPNIENIYERIYMKEVIKMQKCIREVSDVQSEPYTFIYPLLWKGGYITDRNRIIR